MKTWHARYNQQGGDDRTREEGVGEAGRGGDDVKTKHRRNESKRGHTNIVSAHNPAKLPCAYTRPMRPGGEPPPPPSPSPSPPARRFTLTVFPPPSFPPPAPLVALPPALERAPPYPVHNRARHRCDAQCAPLPLPALVWCVSRSSSESTASRVSRAALPLTVARVAVDAVGG
jgi:hypothetical protein